MTPLRLHFTFHPGFVFLLFSIIVPNFLVFLSLDAHFRFYSSFDSNSTVSNRQIMMLYGSRIDALKCINFNPSEDTFMTQLLFDFQLKYKITWEGTKQNSSIHLWFFLFFLCIVYWFLWIYLEIINLSDDEQANWQS